MNERCECVARCHVAAVSEAGCEHAFVPHRTLRAHKVCLKCRQVVKQPVKLYLPSPLDCQDVCSYVSDVAKVNAAVDRHAFLIANGWRHMGDVRLWFYGKAAAPKRLYANLNFDNPCETFSQTQAWFVTLRIIIAAAGHYPLGDWGSREPWYQSAAQNHFKVEPVRNSVPKY